MKKADIPVVPTDGSYTHLPGVLVADHYRVSDDYVCYRPEGTKDWLIMYTLSGKGTVQTEAEGALHCSTGTVTLIPPGTMQYYFTNEGEVWEKIWAHYSPRPSWLDWLPSDSSNGAIDQVRIEDSRSREAVEKAFRRILAYRFDAAGDFREELMLNALEEIILLLAGLRVERRTLDPRIKVVLDLLAREFSENFAIEDLARLVHLSPSRLSHLFKEQVGDSIIAILNGFRLKQAEKLLRYTPHPITEIAFSVGFNSPDFFTRQFVHYYGMSPLQYRKRHLSQR